MQCNSHLRWLSAGSPVRYPVAPSPGLPAVSRRQAPTQPYSKIFTTKKMNLLRSAMGRWLA
jgi:hypothetical protein